MTLVEVMLFATNTPELLYELPLKITFESDKLLVPSPIYKPAPALAVPLITTEPLPPCETVNGSGVVIFKPTTELLVLLPEIPVTYAVLPDVILILVEPPEKIKPVLCTELP